MWCSAVGVIVMLTLSLFVAPLAAEAQSPRQAHRMGFLWNSSPSLTPHLLEAFRHGLSERGYVEGKHFTIESRYAEGNPALLPGLAAEVIGLQVEVIVTSEAPAVQAVRQATNTIPVVMVAVSAPMWAGFVTSLARRGEA
jgi:putative ABC transport system substrate-binding protein